MPTLSQKVDMLFKKFIALKSTVNISGGKSNSFTANTILTANEAYGSKQNITAEQVWTQSKYIPITTNPLNKSLLNEQQILRTTPYTDSISNLDTNRLILLVNNNKILQRLDLELKFIAGSTFAWKYAYNIGSPEFILDFGETSDFKNYNIIPFSFDSTGTIYRYQLYTSKNTSVADATWGTTYTLSGEVPFGANDWFFDNDAVVLNFLDETLPSGVTTSSTLYLRVYRYIGKSGDFATGTSNNSVGDWQNSVVSFIKPVTTAQDFVGNNYFYIQTNFGSYTKGDIYYYNQSNVLTKHILTDKDRFILSNNITLDSYNPDTNITTIDTLVNSNTIIQWWDKDINMTLTSGWISYVPSTGWFTSIDNTLIGFNNIYRFNGTSWIVQEFEQTIPVLDNKNMSASLTVSDCEVGCAVPIVKTPSNDSYVQVFVNGKSCIVGNGYNGVINFDCLFAKSLPNVTLTNTTTLSFSSAHNLKLNEVLIVKTSLGIYKTTITGILNSTDVTIDIIINDTLISVYKQKSLINIEQGDILLWFQSYAGYNLDTNDIIDYNYVSMYA